MPLGVLYRFLCSVFEKHGRTLTKHISWFLVSPIFLTLLLATGLQHFKIEINDDIIVSSESIVGRYKDHLSNLFITDISNQFDPSRSVERIYYGTLIVKAIDDASILRESVFHEIIQLDRHVRNFTISEDGRWNYDDLCAKQNGRCFSNSILLLNREIGLIENRSLLLKYPVDDTRKNYDLLSLGGVQLDSDSRIVGARTLRLFYFLDYEGQKKEARARKWEFNFIEELSKLKFNNIKIAKDISSSTEESRHEIITVSNKYMPYSMILMILFSVFSCLSPDFRRSKPWTGVMSAVATGMSVVSGFGVLLYIGIEPTAATSMVPFLVLGIGMDDTFVMLSAWMKTDVEKSVSDRIAATFSETGVSITITSATNIASFAVGIIFAVLPLHRTFCIYMSVCLTFDYVYQITFVGATLALGGKAEEQNRHSLVFLPLKKDPVPKANFIRKIFCYVKSDPLTQENKLDFFLKNYSEFLSKNVIKISVFVSYAIYLGFAMWGLSKFSYDASLTINLIRGSYRHLYYQYQKEYYQQYQYRLQVIILQEIDYADPLIQRKVESVMQTLESDPLIAGSLMTESWLRSYNLFLSDNRTAGLLSAFNLTNADDYVFVLRNFFLRHPRAKRFRRDVSFDESHKRIVASRFLLQTNVTRDGNHFYSQLTNFRNKLRTAPFAIIVYHPLFHLFDLVDLFPVIAKQTFSAVLITVFLISALLLPNLASIFCILISIISVGVGVMGYMFLWNVRITTTSISVLIVVIGFSVDCAAHVSCAYVSCSEDHPNNRLKKAIVMTAIPVVQGCVTTVLAIVVFAFAPSTDMLNTVKIISLACLIAALHGVMVIPVILSLLDSFRQKVCRRKTRVELRESIDKQEVPSNGIENIAMNESEVHNSL